MKMIHMECPNHPEATLEGYILDCELTLGQEKNRPAIVICPGGGYIYCSPREAEPIALAYAAKGYHAFILRYSTGYDCKGFSPLEEISWVIGYLREHSDEWHIDPDKILTCGFSAGGHLAMAAGVMAENRPNGIILCYPAVSMPNHPSSSFMLQLLTGKQEITDEDSARFDLPSKVDKNSPPVFLVATAEDMLTPHGALCVANTYSSLGLGYELHIFQHGPHGYSLANETSADGSSQVLNSSYATWVDMSVEWMKKTYGKPEFVDKSTSKIMEHIKKLGITMPGMDKGGEFA